MRYSYEFKLLCVDLYKSGIYPDTPNGTTDERFKKNVREWARICLLYTSDAADD